MKKSLLTIASFCSLLVLSGCGQTIEFTKKEYKGKFSDPVHGFRMQLTTTWGIHEGLKDAIVAARSQVEGPNDKFNENVVVTNAKEVASVADLEKVSQELAKQLPGFKQVKATQVGSAFCLEYSYDGPGQKLRATSYFAKASKSPIMVTYTSTDQDFDRWRPEFDKFWSQVYLDGADWPSSTATPAAGATPGASGTPGQSSTPASSSTPEASATPTPAASSTPQATATPSLSTPSPASASPAVASSPTPATSSTPVSSSTPPASTSPAASSTPTSVSATTPSASTSPAASATPGH